MSKKFTEEQYEKIVDIAEHWKNNREQKTKEIVEYIWDNNLTKVGDTHRLDEALAIANPLTREWAHDKFVEKEQKYYWTSKCGTKSGKMHRRLYKGGFSKIHDIYIEDGYPKSENEELTESEVMSSVYNPDMFDREEA